ncbi:BTAD domain-containing putative transcriptional regulator [Streptomyces sp. NPDC086787]|uniref:AfsR/SARP family transcriptional regulator n=1 Tax=Streptomyces sp. NPDC086787 TaxID=3365759 RepID=UPI003828D976
MHASAISHTAANTPDSDADALVGDVRFSLMGPLAAEAHGCALSLGPLKQRLVLAMLLCRPNALVPVGLLTEAVWDGDPPRTARKNLQVYVSALRRTLTEAGAADRLVLRPGGYLIRLAECELDTLRSQSLARAGRAAVAEADTARAARLFTRARMLWHGPALPELSSSAVLRAEAERLTARHLAVCEDWAEAALAAGQAREVAEATADLVEQHPLRERLRAAQMTALHRSGRRAEAMAAYEELRQCLSRELGLSTSPALEYLYRSILADEAGNAGHAGPSGHAGLAGEAGQAGEAGEAAGPGGAGPAARRPAPVQVPADTTDFTGAAGLLTELVETVGGGGPALLVGPAGAGKTAAAVRAAHQLADGFPDGRIVVRLRGNHGTPRPLAATTAELLALTDVPPGSVPADPERAAARWRQWLADRRILLVLDDAPEEAAVRPLLPDTGPAAVVVTARGQLAGLAPAHRVRVPPMPVPEALDLLTRLIGTARLLGDPPAAEGIVTACGSLPLAIRAAGLKLAVLPHLPLAEFASRLADPAAVLDELAVGDIDVRSRVAEEWWQLDGAHRLALTRLARLPLAETFTLEDAATALGCAAGQARRELELMIEAGAVVSPGSETTAHAAAYSLPYLTHLYARETASAGRVTAEAPHPSCGHAISVPSPSPV